MGVDLFFVLSGFLVGGMLLAELKKNGELNIKRFLSRRGLKIWPAYFLYLLFLFSGLTVTEEQKSSLLLNLLHIQNYFTSARGHTWSLAVEEHFYLLLPFVLHFMTRRLAWIPAMTAMICAGCLVGRFNDLSHAYAATHLRIDSLFFGVFLAYLQQFHGDALKTAVSGRRVLLAAGGFLMILPVMLVPNARLNEFVLTFGFSMNYLGFGAILLSLLYTKEQQGLMGRLLFSRIAKLIARIGYFSYGIYLWHMDLGYIPTLMILPFLAGLPGGCTWLFAMVFLIACSVVGGVLSTLLIELPVLKLRDRLVPTSISAAYDGNVADEAPGRTSVQGSLQAIQLNFSPTSSSDSIDRLPAMAASGSLEPVEQEARVLPAALPPVGALDATASAPVD